MITEREIRKAAEKLKNNKSPFSDKISNKMIKASIIIDNFIKKTIKILFTIN